MSAQEEPSLSEFIRKRTNEPKSTAFKCPACGKSTIVRTFNERQIVSQYRCPECGFTGPN